MFQYACSQVICSDLCVYRDVCCLDLLQLPDHVVLCVLSILFSAASLDRDDMKVVHMCMYNTQ